MDDDQVGELVATQDMCNYCFDVLLEKILRASSYSENTNKGRKNNELVPQLNVSRSLESPLFVTWEKRRSSFTPAVSPISSGFTTPTSSNILSDDDSSDRDSSEYDLRGCIGTLAPRQLQKALSEFALSSAFVDRRFDPITLHEVQDLRVGVSLLVKYEECKNCFDWKVGTHGIIIKFEVDRKGKTFGELYSATYLPEVAYEQRWNQEKAIVSLVRKAGYRGSITDDFLKKLQCTRYQSSKCQITYQDYVQSKWYGDDPLSRVDIMTVAAVDETLRQKIKASKTCEIL